MLKHNLRKCFFGEQQETIGAAEPLLASRDAAAGELRLHPGVGPPQISVAAGAFERISKPIAMPNILPEERAKSRLFQHILQCSGGEMREMPRHVQSVPIGPEPRERKAFDVRQGD